jgi:L-ascorbate metabolism protein UlaG (beta-lactamase superfamily)
MVLCGTVIFFVIDRMLAAPRYSGAVTSHFDGKVFDNLAPTKDKGFFDILRWQLSAGERGAWMDYRDAAPGAAPPRETGRGELRVTFVNHATVLIQIDGVNILTDPIWSERASPFSFIGPKRVRPPGLRFEDLPPIHAVIVSHNHYDHMDMPTLRRLAKEHNAPVYVGLGNRALLEREGVAGGVDMDWWRTVELNGGVRLTSVPVRHWTARATSDRRRTLWCGFVIEGTAGNVYFAGDTGYGNHFAQARERFKSFRVALLPIGAYRPVWFMSDFHMSPQEAIRAHDDLQTETSIAVHFGTFPLADDGEQEASDELRRLLEQREGAAPGSDGRGFVVLHFGESMDVSSAVQ